MADILGQLNFWEPLLHDIGECKVKHGVRVHLFNLYTEADGIGSVELPAKRIEFVLLWSPADTLANAQA